MANYILNIDTLHENNDKVMISVKSLLDGWEDKIVIFKNTMHHRLNVIRANRMKIYITNYLKRRMKAFQVMKATNDPRYDSMKNLLHHISTTHKRWDEYMRWMARREGTLRDVLPTKVDKSHARIETILHLCKTLPDQDMKRD